MRQVIKQPTSEASPQTDECKLVILSERSERRISLHQLRNEMLRGVYPEHSRRAQHDRQNLASFVKDRLYEDVECKLVILSKRSERRISLHQLRNEMLRGVYPEHSRRAQHDRQNLASFVKDRLYEDVECKLVILSKRSERRISLHQLRNEMLRFAQHDMQNLVSFVKDRLYEDV